MWLVDLWVITAYIYIYIYSGLSQHIYIYRNYHKCKGRTLVFKVWVILSSSLGYTYLTVELDALTVVSFLSTINVHSGLITEMDDCICLLSIRKQIGAPW